MTPRLQTVIILLYSSSLMGQTISGTVNSYYQVTAINTASNTVTLNTTSGLSTGTKVLLMQMKGANIDGSNTSSFGSLTTLNDAGNYEFNYICSISGNNATLQYQLIKTYDPTNQVQLVSVPVYQSVTISGKLLPAAWSSATGTGGIVAIEATDTIFLNDTVDVSGQGFQGGTLVNWATPPYTCDWFVTVNAYYLSNPPSEGHQTGGLKGESIANYIAGKEYGMGRQLSGGGGGNNTNTGGGGGGNYGTGGIGGQKTMESFLKCHGQFPGLGGASLSGSGYTVAQNRIYFGGGGGSGHENNAAGLGGGNGGGIAILTASVITGSGSAILANGLAPVNSAKVPDSTEADSDGAGGGGAGGTIIINATKVNGSISVQANGGNGANAGNIASDCTGPGGGGGAGVIWASGAVFPAAVTASVTGGANGVIANTDLVTACRGSSNNAAPGNNGASLTGYVAPIGTSPACSLLASSELISFTGNLTEAGAQLYWKMNSTSGIASYNIQRSIDRVSYQTIGTEISSNQTVWNYTDNQRLDGTVYYRLEIVYSDGTTAYSAIVALNRYSEETIQVTGLLPNPASDQLTLSFYAKNQSASEIMIYNAYGQRLITHPMVINTGYSKVSLGISNLASGIYFLLVKGKDIQVVKRFIKIGRP